MTASVTPIREGAATSAASDVEYLLDVDVAARIPGMTKDRLAKHAYEGDGPFFTMIGRKRVYAWSDVQAWMRENRTRRTDRFGEHS